MLTPTRVSPTTCTKNISPLLLQQISQASKVPPDRSNITKASSLPNLSPSGAGATYQRFRANAKPKTPLVSRGPRPLSRDSVCQAVQYVPFTSSFSSTVPSTAPLSNYRRPETADALFVSTLQEAGQNVHETSRSVVQESRSQRVQDFSRQEWGNSRTRAGAHLSEMPGRGGTQRILMPCDDEFELQDARLPATLQELACVEGDSCTPQRMLSQGDVHDRESQLIMQSQQQRPSASQSHVPSVQTLLETPLTPPSLNGSYAARRLPRKDQNEKASRKSTTRFAIGSGGKVGLCFSSKPVDEDRAGCACCNRKIQNQCQCDPFDDAPPSEALERSLELIGTLYDMRRQAFKKADGTEAQDVKNSMDAQELTMVKALLANTQDTSEILQQTIKNFEDGTQNAQDLGGGRHPTTVATVRALAVARRKSHVLSVVENQYEAFKAANKRRNGMLIEVAYQDGDPPSELLDVADFIESWTHSPANPAEDAGMLAFENFARTFKLPAKHSLLVEFAKDAEESGLWWADKCLELANKGGDTNNRKARLAKLNGEAVDDSYRLNHFQLKKVARIAFTSGLDVDGPKLRELRSTLSDRLAEAVLTEAQKIQQEDTKMAEESNLPPVGPAWKAAEKIEKLIYDTIAEGCPDCHPKLEQARNVVKELYAADGERKRLANRAKRQAPQ